MGLGYTFRDGDWARLRQIIQKMSSLKFGPDAAPTFSGLTLTGLTPNRLIASDSDSTLVSQDLFAYVAGTTNRVTVADDGDGTITLSAPQDIHTGASPTFLGLTLSGLTGSRLVSTDVSNGLTSVANLASWVAGTTNQITVTNDGDGTITLATPQNIHTGAIPTFAGLTLNNGTYSNLYAFVFNLPAETPAVGTATGKAWMPSVINTDTVTTFRLVNRANNLVAPSVFEDLIISYISGLSKWVIKTELVGSGSGYAVRALSIETGSNGNQILLSTNGAVSMNTGSLSITAGGAVVSGGNVVVSSGYEVQVVSTFQTNYSSDQLRCNSTYGLIASAFEFTTQGGSDDVQISYTAFPNTGVFTWMTDEDYFEFSDDILLLGTNRLYFSNTNTSLVFGAAGDLDLYTPANKTLELQTVVWKDINLGAASVITPSSAYPDVDELKDEAGADTGIETYAFGLNESISALFEMQHDYKEGSDIYFHIHWQGITAPAGGTDNVQWRLAYTITRDGNTINAITTVDSPDKAITAQYQCNRSDFAAIAGATGGIDGGFIRIGDQFCFKLSRVAATADEYAGDALFITAGLHYQIDTIGSRQISDK